MTEHGAIIIDAMQVATTQRCPHCGGHFLVAKGNLEMAQRQLGALARPKVRCLKCDRLTCGRPGCDPAIACVPIEARLEFAEGTQTRYADAIAALQQRGIEVI